MYPPYWETPLYKSSAAEDLCLHFRLEKTCQTNPLYYFLQRKWILRFFFRYCCYLTPRNDDDVCKVAASFCFLQ